MDNRDADNRISPVRGSGNKIQAKDDRQQVSGRPKWLPQSFSRLDCVGRSRQHQIGKRSIAGTDSGVDWRGPVGPASSDVCLHRSRLAGGLFRRKMILPRFRRGRYGCMAWRTASLTPALYNAIMSLTDNGDCMPRRWIWRIIVASLSPDWLSRSTSSKDIDWPTRTD